MIAESPKTVKIHIIEMNSEVIIIVTCLLAPREERREIYIPRKFTQKLLTSE